MLIFHERLRGRMRRRATAVFVTFFVLACGPSAYSQQRREYSVLAIEYLGPQDHPIHWIVISDSSKGADWYRNTQTDEPFRHFTYEHEVGASVLEKLIADVELYRGNSLKEQQKTPQSLKYVRMTICRGERRNAYSYDIESALPLLDLLQKHSKDKQLLQSHLAEFQGEMQFWRAYRP